MPTLILRHATLDGAKADLVKHNIRVTLNLPLNEQTLELRSKLAYLAVEKESVTVTIESAQIPLFEDKPGKTSLDANIQIDPDNFKLDSSGVFRAHKELALAVESILEPEPVVEVAVETETPKRKPRSNAKTKAKRSAKRK